MKKYLKFLVLMPVSWFLILISLPLALVFPLIAKNGWLPDNWFCNLFQTPDNSLHGDYGWLTEHWQWRFDKRIPLGLSDYIGQVGWLWRNPAYGFGVTYISGKTPATFKGDNLIRDNLAARGGWCFVQAGDLFQLTVILPYKVVPLCLMLNFGYNIRALVDDHVNPKPDPYQATYTASIRPWAKFLP